MPHWVLPDHFADVLPPEAWRIEQDRQALLTLLRGYGYELVLPPLIEYLDALLVGTGYDLRAQMFQLSDIRAGKTLALRADMTTQASRIDAHILNRPGVTRLCYVGTVVRRLPEDWQGNAEPLQLGAELYGHAGIEADIEIVTLAQHVLQTLGVHSFRVDIGHVAIVEALFAQHNITHPELRLELLAALQRKARSRITALCVAADAQQGAAASADFCSLTQLYGNWREVCQRARTTITQSATVSHALMEIEQLCDGLPETAAHVDLADLRGYDYHSGMMFAIYSAQSASPLIRGGRYDGVGRAFGRARPATGFSIDLRALKRMPDISPAVILAPWPQIKENAAQQLALQQTVAHWRANGEVVVQISADSLQSLTLAQAHSYHAKALLRWQAGAWQLVTLDTLDLPA